MHIWFKKYLQLFFSDRKASEEYKCKNIPSKLYKYQPISDKLRENRIKNLKENNLWLSATSNLNDPYDCNATYFDEQEISSILTNNKFNKATNNPEEFLMDKPSDTLELFKSNINLACFSEVPSNMPLWGNYADNHKGICIEYDFTKVSPDDKFIKHLFPVFYEEERYDITEILKQMVSGKFNRKTYLLFFLCLIKHSSWEYEKEWRVFNLEPDLISKKNSKGISINLPVEPTAIFFGLNCSEKDILEISEIYEGKSTKLHRVKTSNHKFFNVTEMI